MSTRLTLAALGAGILILAGCSGESPPPAGATDPPSVIPTPSASPSEETSAPPEGREDPEAFIRRWVEASTEMQNSGETAAFLRLTRGCDPCQALAQQVELIYDQGGTVQTDGWRLRSIELGARDGGVREYQLEVETGSTVLVESANAEPQRIEADTFSQFIRIRPRGNAWVVVNYGEYV